MVIGEGITRLTATGIMIGIAITTGTAIATGIMTETTVGGQIAIGAMTMTAMTVGETGTGATTEVLTRITADT